MDKEVLKGVIRRIVSCSLERLLSADIDELLSRYECQNSVPLSVITKEVEQLLRDKLVPSDDAVVSPSSQGKRSRTIWLPACHVALTTSQAHQLSDASNWARRFGLPYVQFQDERKSEIPGNVDVTLALPDFSDGQVITTYFINTSDECNYDEATQFYLERFSKHIVSFNHVSGCTFALAVKEPTPGMLIVAARKWMWLASSGITLGDYALAKEIDLPLSIDDVRQLWNKIEARQKSIISNWED
jgi:hypothetical protein